MPIFKKKPSTVPEARGIAAEVLLSELQRSNDQSPHSVRWALANALTVVADEPMADAIESLVANDDYADVRERTSTLSRSLSTIVALLVLPSGLPIGGGVSPCTAL